MKHAHSQSSLDSTTNKTSYLPQTTRCFDSTTLNEPELNLANQNYIQGEDYVLPVILDQYDIIDIFEVTSNQMKMQMIEKQGNYATAIMKSSRGASLSDYFNCLAWWNHKKTNITAIKINIHTNKNVHNSQVRLCRLKILGRKNQTLISQFITSFRNKVCRIDGLYKGPITFDTIATQERTQQNQTNPFHLQSCAYYILHKMLAGGNQKETQEINQKLEKSLQQFYESFKNITESSDSLPTPMINAIEISNEIAEEIRKMIKESKTINIDYNLIYPYLKIAVEKHVFDKVGSLLRRIYYENSKKQSQIFLEKSRKIKEELSISDIFKQILLPRQLQIVKDRALLDNKELSEKQKRQNIGFTELAYRLISIKNLSNISNTRETIKCCQIMYAELKSYFYEQLNKKYQLNSMEDIIPVFIVIVLFCGNSNEGSKEEKEQVSLRAELNMMLDFINSESEQFEAQKRLIINLSQSYNYIVRDWKI